MRNMLRYFTLGAAAALLAACSSSQDLSLPAPPAPGEPPGLVGLNGQKLRLAFGVPAFVRTDGAGQMWRYDAPRCKAFFFLYARDGGYEVRHVETLPRGTERMAADANCLDAVRAQASPPVS